MLAVLALVGTLYVDSTARCADRSSETGPVVIDRAVEWGADFTHFNGMSGEFYFPEMTGQGVALFDYDRDGDLDAYFVQGSMLGPNKDPSEATFPPRKRGELRSASPGCWEPKSLPARLVPSKGPATSRAASTGRAPIASCSLAMRWAFVRSALERSSESSTCIANSEVTLWLVAGELGQGWRLGPRKEPRARRGSEN